jgi:hypothetical protein
MNLAMIYAYMIIHGHLHAIYRYTHNINLLGEGCLFVCHGEIFETMMAVTSMLVLLESLH